MSKSKSEGDIAYAKKRKAEMDVILPKIKKLSVKKLQVLDCLVATYVPYSSRETKGMSVFEVYKRCNLTSYTHAFNILKELERAKLIYKFGKKDYTIKVYVAVALVELTKEKKLKIPKVNKMALNNHTMAVKVLLTKIGKARQFYLTGHDYIGYTAKYRINVQKDIIKRMQMKSETYNPLVGKSFRVVDKLTGRFNNLFNMSSTEVERLIKEFYIPKKNEKEYDGVMLWVESKKYVNI